MAQPNEKAKLQEAARQWTQKQKHDKAAAELRKALSLDGHDASLALEWADACERAGQRADAQEGYGLAVRLLRHQGQLPRALAVLDAWLDRAPSQVDARLEKAELLYAMDQAEAGRAEYGRAAEWLVGQRGADEYVARLRQRAETAPALLRVRLASLLDALGKRGEAVAELKVAVHVLKRDNDKAAFADAAERLLLLAPGELEVGKDLSHHYLSVEQAQKALQPLRAAIAANPMDEEALELLAQVFAKLKAPEREAMILERLVEVFRRDRQVERAAETIARIRALSPARAAALDAQAPEAVRTAENFTRRVEVVPQAPRGPKLTSLSASGAREETQAGPELLHDTGELDPHAVTQPTPLSALGLPPPRSLVQPRPSLPPAVRVDMDVADTLPPRSARPAPQAPAAPALPAATVSVGQGLSAPQAGMRPPGQGPFWSPLDGAFEAIAQLPRAQQGPAARRAFSLLLRQAVAVCLADVLSGPPLGPLDATLGALAVRTDAERGAWLQQAGLALTRRGGAFWPGLCGWLAEGALASLLAQRAELDAPAAPEALRMREASFVAALEVGAEPLHGQGGLKLVEVHQQELRRGGGFRTLSMNWSLGDSRVDALLAQVPLLRGSIYAVNPESGELLELSPLLKSDGLTLLLFREAHGASLLLDDGAAKVVATEAQGEDGPLSFADWVARRGLVHRVRAPKG
jgi:tetratricopeptide (TPR) repeat protein